MRTVSRLSRILNIACLSLLGAPGVAPAEIGRSMLDAIGASVLKLLVVDFQGRSATGTAVAVGQGKAVTACHVTKDAVAIRVVDEAHMSYQATSQRRDVKHDICLLKIEGLRAPPVKVGSVKSLREGVPIAAFGYTFGKALDFRIGIVERLHGHDGSRVIQVSASFARGDSGGGIFNEQGELVATMSFTLGQDKVTNFAVPADWFAEKVDDDDGYTPINQLAPGRPFFINSFDGLPYFLRAAKFERERRWDDLQKLSSKWIAEETGNAEAWLMHGAASTGLGNDSNAADAYRAALALGPNYTSSGSDLLFIMRSADSSVS